MAEYNKRALIQRYITNKSDLKNFDNGSWTDYKPVYCSANPIYGEQRTEARKSNIKDVVNFKIRYKSCKDLNDKDRIKFRGKYYNIIDVDNVKFENKELKFKGVAKK